MFVKVLGLSLLVHGLVLFTHWRSAPDPLTAAPGPSDQRRQLAVRLQPAVPPAAAAPAAAPPPPARRVAPPPATARPPAARRPARQPLLPRPTPPLPSAPPEVARIVPTPPPAPVPTPESPRATAPDPLRSAPLITRPSQLPGDDAPGDMMAMVEAEHARRQGGSSATAPSENDVAMANIQRNLRVQNGTRDAAGGVFQILSKGTRAGQFAFRGWRAETRNTWYEVIDVDAGLMGDLELAMVRRMIQLIRSQYPGDFNWESHRLGRVIVLSARKEDSERLEAFLLKEFFPAR